MADQNKDRGSSGDNLDRDDDVQGTPGSRRRSSTDSEGMGDEEELTRGTGGRSGSSAMPSNTGGSTSGTNRGSGSTGGAQNTGRATDDIDIDDFDDIDGIDGIDDVSGNR